MGRAEGRHGVGLGHVVVARAAGGGAGERTGRRAGRVERLRGTDGRRSWRGRRARSRSGPSPSRGKTTGSLQGERDGGLAQDAAGGARRLGARCRWCRRQRARRGGCRRSPPVVALRRDRRDDQAAFANARDDASPRALRRAARDAGLVHLELGCPGEADLGLLAAELHRRPVLWSGTRACPSAREGARRAASARGGGARGRAAGGIRGGGGRGGGRLGGGRGLASSRRRSRRHPRSRRTRGPRRAHEAPGASTRAELAVDGDELAPRDGPASGPQHHAVRGAVGATIWPGTRRSLARERDLPRRAHVHTSAWAGVVARRRRASRRRQRRASGRVVGSMATEREPSTRIRPADAGRERLRARAPASRTSPASTPGSHVALREALERGAGGRPRRRSRARCTLRRAGRARWWRRGRRRSPPSRSAAACATPPTCTASRPTPSAGARAARRPSATHEGAPSSRASAAASTAAAAPSAASPGRPRARELRGSRRARGRRRAPRARGRSRRRRAHRPGARAARAARRGGAPRPERRDARASRQTGSPSTSPSAREGREPGRRTRAAAPSRPPRHRGQRGQVEGPHRRRERGGGLVHAALAGGGARGLGVAARPARIVGARDRRARNA